MSEPGVAVSEADRALVRRLMRLCRHGSLATLMADGAPYASLVATASLPDGSPLLLISQLAVHTRNLLADSRASILLSDGGAGDPLQQPRIMVSATADIVGDLDRAQARRRYLAVHPSAELFADFRDFVFVRLRPTAIHLVAGFGRIRDIDPGTILTNVNGARSLLDAEPDAVAHLNADHADALALYAARLCGASGENWRCTGLDPEGIDLANEHSALRIDFREPVTNPLALRRTLAELSRTARASVDRADGN
jgi:putative heme iron utilization protein